MSNGRKTDDRDGILPIPENPAYYTITTEFRICPEQAERALEVGERIARALEGLLELAESAAQAPNDEEG
jgi:hypothetical protein